MCWRHLGSTTGVTEKVLKINPHIDNKNPVLPIGTRITLPDFHLPVKKSLICGINYAWLQIRKTII
ncbi:tail protein X [Candidatus Vondammii sp. HM_W22]|uniref:tail protein X n=1 Tax=Candidatus Vondammii sp. HM_W22 TaxID=2687299 RepID=UPI001F1349F3|nr:tail protein X [Candidatus Vondammii sp. HM_W22]